MSRQFETSPWRRRYWISQAGIALLSFGAIACAPQVEENSRSAVESEPAPISEDAAIATRVDKPDDTADAADAADYQPTQDRLEILMIGPRPDREPPLQDCGSLKTQQDMNACAYENYQAVDAELNEAYQRLKSALSEDGQQALVAAELAWLDFRDLDCRLERSQFEGGSIAPLIHNSCLEARTNIRINELYEPVASESSYQAADSALNSAYQDLAKVINSPRDETLLDAQLAWIEYRDRHCEFETTYGAADLTADQCKARLSEKRTRQLRAATEQNSL